MKSHPDCRDNSVRNSSLQDHGLAKNCLRYIEVVAGACQRGGHSAAVAACGDGSATQFLRDALQLAASVAKLATDLRLQASTLGCSHTKNSRDLCYMRSDLAY